MSGILSIGAYVPLMRLQRAAVYEANKWFAPGLRGLARGERAIANWDEDVVTMAVEAARDCLVGRSEEHTSELQSLMRISYAVFCLKTKTRRRYDYKQHNR